MPNEKNFSEKFRKARAKAPVVISPLSKITDLKPEILLKMDSNTKVYLGILWDFSEN